MMRDQRFAGGYIVIRELFEGPIFRPKKLFIFPEMVVI